MAGEDVAKELNDEIDVLRAEIERLHQVVSNQYEKYRQTSERWAKEMDEKVLQIEQLQKIVGSMPPSEIASWGGMSFDEAVAILKGIPEKQQDQTACICPPQVKCPVHPKHCDCKFHGIFVEGVCDQCGLRE